LNQKERQRDEKEIKINDMIDEQDAEKVKEEAKENQYDDRYTKKLNKIIDLMRNLNKEEENAKNMLNRAYKDLEKEEIKRSFFRHLISEFINLISESLVSLLASNNSFFISSSFSFSLIPISSNFATFFCST
jgi:hypothetical protein